jgi:RNA polymerase sigma-70 factor (ECF subfamily)
VSIFIRHKKYKTKGMDIEGAVKQIQNVEEGYLDAFEFIVEKFKDRVFTVCYRMIGNSEDARDISQDTFIEVFVKLKTLQEPEKFSAWIYKIAVNKSLNFLRKREKISPLFQENIFVTCKNNDDFVKKDAINHFLGKLTFEYRIVLILFYIEEKQIREISEILDITESAVKMRLKRARERLKQIEEIEK